MTASPPSDTKAAERKWLPWVIGLAVVLLLAWWARGCGKVPETGMAADTTQAMMAPDTASAAAAPAPAPVETASPTPPADTAPVKGTTGSGPRIKESPAGAPAAAVPESVPTGPGAMGGHGEPGKKPPATTP